MVAIEMVRSPELDDAEIARRLAMCYNLIINCARRTREKATDKCEADRPEPIGGSDASTLQPDAQGKGYTE